MYPPLIYLTLATLVLPPPLSHCRRPPPDPSPTKHNSNIKQRFAKVYRSGPKFEIVPCVHIVHVFMCIQVYVRVCVLCMLDMYIHMYVHTQMQSECKNEVGKFLGYIFQIIFVRFLKPIVHF